MRVVSDQLNAFLSGGAPSAAPQLARSFERLKGGLEALSGLPLQIVAVHRVGDALLGTSSTPPTRSAAVLGAAGAAGAPAAGRVDLFVAPHEVAIEFQFSGKWPQRGDADGEDAYDDEIVAIKSSFLVLMGRGLREMFDYPSVAADDCLDVLLDGFVFRLRLHHRQPRPAPGLAPRRDPREDAERAALMHAKLVEAMARREQNFAATCRLCKRWMGSQMFSTCMAAENVELMVVHCFTNARR